MEAGRTGARGRGDTRTVVLAAGVAHCWGDQERTGEIIERSGEIRAGMVGLDPKRVRLDHKLDKSGTFSDQISVHLAHRAKCTEF